MNRRCCLFIAGLFTATLAPAAAAPASAGSDFPQPVEIESGWQLRDASSVSATGAEISTTRFARNGWRPAVVPGSVLTSLVADGVYPEPLYGENNRPDRIPDSLCRTSYWYRTEFRVPKSFDGRDVELNFHGINYTAEVWLNGIDLGSIRGAFARGDFDITNSVRRNAPNVLAVSIQPPPDPGTPNEHTLANGLGKNGGILAKDGPTFLCSMGWDWIPGIRDRDMGIWQKVTLSAHGPVTVRDSFVSSDLPLPRTDSADLTVETTLANSTSKPEAGVLEGRFDGVSFRYPVTAAAGESKVVTLTPAQIGVLHVTNPKLWWPNGFGPQNLHRMRLAFVDNGRESDVQTVTFGIRKITYSVPGSENLTLSVNGVPIFCKGGDWGIDEAMKREPYKRLDAQIRMHRDANYTIIRNWVGQSTSEDFYDLCDKYGIMVWDEFFQPNPGDGPNPADTDLYLANVREKILRFRSHPCIALWCGRNEGLPPQSILTALGDMLAKLDPNRLFQPSSTAGRGVHSSGPYSWREPAAFYSYSEAFKTEIGSVSVPTLESIKAMMPEKDWGMIDDDWAEHDLARGAQGGDRYPVQIATRYGSFSSLADFVRKAQMANYEAFRAMYEGRAAQLFHPETGVITWMSNPAQPSFVWQIYAWDLEPNASFFAVRKACEPVHIQLNQTDWRIMAINNTPRRLDGLTAKATVYNLDGSLAFTRTYPVSAAPSSATPVDTLEFPSNLSAVHFVELELRDARRNLVSNNFYWRETQSGDFTALNSLPPARIDVAVSRKDSGSDVLLTVALANRTKTPAIMAHLQLRNGQTGRRVLPVFYSDNYVSLLPGEEKTITIDADRADVGAGSPTVFVDGWNVRVNSGPMVALNDDAVVSAGAPVPPAASADPAVRIHCGGVSTSRIIFGGGADPGSFDTDADFTGGIAYAHDAPVDTAAPHAGPRSLYITERHGVFSYTIPVKPASGYLVRLHFAETKYDHPGARKFNVSIDGRQVLSEYDIFVDAGGRNKAVVRDFPVDAPQASGAVVIDFTRGSVDDPKVCGIEVLPNPAAQAGPTAKLPTARG